MKLWCVHLSYNFSEGKYEENVRIFYTAEQALIFCHKMLTDDEFYESEGEPDDMSLWTYEEDTENGGFAQTERPLFSWSDVGVRR